jgi:hypothetical protein
MQLPVPFGLPDGAAPLPGYDGPRAAIDPFGGVVVANIGNPDPSNGSTGDIVTMKYDGLTGRALWPEPAIYDTGEFIPDYPTSVLLDGSGDVIVMGLTRLSAFGEHVTLKYDGDTGSLVWGPAVLYPISSPGTASLDAFDDLFVSVSKFFTGSERDFATVKYSSFTGATIGGPVRFDDDELPAQARAFPELQPLTPAVTSSSRARRRTGLPL